MINIIEQFANHIAIFPIMGACIAFTWGAFQFLINRSRENDEAQFKRFHEVIRKIQHDIEDGKHTNPYIEIQVAAIYELRFLKRYHPASEIYLIKKRDEWTNLGGSYLMYGVPIIDSTLEYISKGGVFKRIKRSFSSFYKDNPFS